MHSERRKYVQLRQSMRICTVHKIRKQFLKMEMLKNAQIFIFLCNPVCLINDREQTHCAVPGLCPCFVRPDFYFVLCLSFWELDLQSTSWSDIKVRKYCILKHKSCVTQAFQTQILTPWWPKRLILVKDSYERLVCKLNLFLVLPMI